jgi:hypothetical protein
VLIRKRQEIFMAAVLTFHTGKAVVQIAVVEIPVNDLLQIGPTETVMPWRDSLLPSSQTLSVPQKQEQPGEADFLNLDNG